MTDGHRKGVREMTPTVQAYFIGMIQGVTMGILVGSVLGWLINGRKK